MEVRLEVSNEICMFSVRTKEHFLKKQKKKKKKKKNCCFTIIDRG